MKKKILSVLPLLLFTITIVNAQFVVEQTNYRGAFAPAPTPMWTDNWTNWNPQNTFYAAPTVNVSGTIASNTTWTKNNVYLLQGLVYVDSLVTLTIEPGTVIRGDANTIISTLIIQRGATIIANGTPCNPIVFTSSRAAGSRVKGDWGGIIVLGRGITNLGTNVNVEGIGASEPRARFGGTDNADNSGSLKYIRIEYAGYQIAVDNEINSITFGGVGSATTVDYIQTSFGNDDAFEWFGGAVNCKHLVAYRTLDDDFDTDNGYNGTVQFALSVKDPNVADNNSSSTSEGFESDNNNPAPFTLLPKTSASFYNVTQIGAFRCANNTPSVTIPTATPAAFRRGARLRRNTQLKIYNSILMNNWRGLVMDADVIANSATAGGAAFQNNVIAMDLTTVWPSPYAGAAVAAENAATNTYLTAPANLNSIVSTPCDVLADAWNFLNPDYRPNSTAGSSGANLSGCDLTPGIQIETALFTANQTAEVVVDVFENAVGNSNGTITVTIPVPSGWTIALLGGPALTATPTLGAVNGTAAAIGAPFDNTKWLFSISGGNLVATSIPGFVVTAGNSASIGLTAKRNASTPSGTNQSLTVTVSGGADNNSNNDGALSGLGAL
jgi:hypothetical protein